ncbi:hypothetical protein CR513_18636, partial [Mucuna pruriens]
MNLGGNASAVTLRSGKELPQPAQQQTPKSAEADSEAIADSQSCLETAIPLPFPSRTISARRPESDEELLKMFRKVEINIPLLDAIKQVPKYAKFLKELCVHKRRKIKGSREIGGVVLALTKNEEFTAGTSRALPRKCRDPGIFFVSCTIGECTFVDAMLDLGALINVMLASIYRSLNFARTKIDVHAGMLSMEFGDTLVQFNIFEAVTHPTEDHSLFGIDMIEELDEVQESPNPEANHNDIADLAFEAELIELLDQVYYLESLQYINNAEVKVVETKKPAPAQLATIFTVETKSANAGRVNTETKVNSTKHLRNKTDNEDKSAKEG